MFRRIANASLVVAIAAVMLLVVPAPASAVEPPPPPVTPASGLPSWTGVYYNPEGLTPGSPAYNTWKANFEAKLAAAGYGPPKAPITVQQLKPSASLPFKPITLPTNLSAGARGGILGAAALVGFAVGQGGLATYAVATGTDPWAAMCKAQPGPEAVLADIQRGINFGIGPDCIAILGIQPDGDQPATGGTLTYGGGTLTYTHDWSNGFGTTHQCMTQTQFGPPAGMNYYGLDSTGTRMQLGIGNNLAQCGTSFPTGAYWPKNGPTGVPFSGIWIASPSAPNTKLAESVESRPSPDRVPTCGITWDDGTTTTGTGTTYKEPGGAPTSVGGLGCANAWASKYPGGGYAGGTMPSRIKVDSNDGTTNTTLLDTPVPPASAEQKAALANPSTVGLVLTKTTNGQTDSCMTWLADCSGWWAATSNGTTAYTGAATYTCSFGGSAVTLSECGIYRHTFDVRTNTPTITDPVTGEQTEWISAPASSSPWPGGSIDPSTGPGTGENPSAECLTQWPSSPDPISWVLHPIKCALVWAFVPRTSAVEAAFAEANTTWATKPPAVIAEAVALFAVAPTSSGGSIQVHILGIDGEALNTCEGSSLHPLSVFARLATSAYLGIAVLGKLRQQAAAMVNYNVGQT